MKIRLSAKRNLSRLLIGAAIVLVGLSAVPALFAQDTSPSSPTEKIPFNTWLDGKNISQIPWTIKVVPPELTEYQRYQASIMGYVFPDKADVEDSRAKLVAIARFTDSHGKSYEANDTFTLPMRSFGQPEEIVMNFTAYLLPGEYKVAMVVYGTTSHKYSVTHQTFRVPRISNDPLPRAWNNLPAVEFFTMRTPLGLVDSRLNLPLQTNQPIRVEVIANITPTHAVKPYPVIYRHNRDAIFPELNVLSQIKATNGTLDVVALELDTQKIAFEQDGIETMNALRLWNALDDHNGSIVEASALGGESGEAKFFLSEVRKRISALAKPSDSQGDHPATVVIVLSNEMAFPKGEDLAPISAPVGCNCRVFYIRTHIVLDTYATQALMNLPMTPTFRIIIGEEVSRQPVTVERMPNFPPLGEGITKIPNVDQLEKTLAPLNPRILEVKDVKDFRKAVAVILREAGEL